MLRAVVRCVRCARNFALPEPEDIDRHEQQAAIAHIRDRRTKLTAEVLSWALLLLATLIVMVGLINADPFALGYFIPLAAGGGMIILLNRATPPESWLLNVVRILNALTAALGALLVAGSFQFTMSLALFLAVGAAIFIATGMINFLLCNDIAKKTKTEAKQAMSESISTPPPLPNSRLSATPSNDRSDFVFEEVMLKFAPDLEDMLLKTRLPDGATVASALVTSEYVIAEVLIRDIGGTTAEQVRQNSREVLEGQIRMLRNIVSSSRFPREFSVTVFYYTVSATDHWTTRAPAPDASR